MSLYFQFIFRTLVEFLTIFLHPSHLNCKIHGRIKIFSPVVAKSENAVCFSALAGSGTFYSM